MSIQCGKMLCQNQNGRKAFKRRLPKFERKNTQLAFWTVSMLSPTGEREPFPFP